MVDREHSDNDIDSRIAAVERARAEALSGPVQERLAAARRQAVAAMDEDASPGFGWSVRWGYVLPAGAVAAVTLVVALQFTQSTPEVPDAATLAELLPHLDESQQVAAREMELLEELEFLAWMAEADELDAG